ncbi:hypothetical protein [Candidatus Nitronereus thalassa]|uniref:Lipoprotein n=1 Tax=Candidatus Nitronereus thalassa TaxID=3020898 RepID=A0ABU3K313_9BACT|nr:hypothetical protein [Candidatus Nitronereus thalassa]MDT7040771.1 hypothetical protein [Candidatus Nitronereus thalassa]
MKQRIWLVLLGSLFLMILTSCVSTSPQELLKQEDHKTLAAWYQQEAASLRTRAKEMLQLAKRYEYYYRDGDYFTRMRILKHCRFLVEEYTTAATEADALAKAHAEANRPE